MMRDPDFVREVFDCLDPRYFAKDDYAILSSIILEYFRTNGKPPHREDLVILIYDKAKQLDPDGSLGRVSTLQAWVSRLYDVQINDIKLVKDKIRDFGRLQAIAHAIQKGIGFLEETTIKAKSDDVVAKIIETVTTAGQVGTDRTSGMFFHDVAMDIPRILREDALYGKDSKVPTGIDSLDKVLGGGPGAGTINVVMAPPNRGKSTFLAWLGIAASKHFAVKALTTGVQKTVIHITCEMTESDIMAKYCSGITGIETDLLADAQNYASLMEPRMEQAGPISVKFYPPGTPTVDDILWYINNLVTIHKVIPGMLIVDYADKLRGMEDDRYNGMGVIYNRLIEMGHKFGIPVWTGSQVNREEAKKSRHSVTGAGDSWRKVEIADNIVILNQTEEEHEEGLMILGLGKIRRGSKQAGNINCRVDFGRVRIQQLQGDENMMVEQAHAEAVPVEPIMEIIAPDIPEIPDIMVGTNDTGVQSPLH